MNAANRAKRAVIIDRTLPEIYTPGRMSRLDIMNFCWLLNNAGVDVIEVNARILGIIGKPALGLDFLLDVEAVEELSGYAGSGIRGFVLKPSLLAMGEAGEIILEKGINAVLEVYTDDIGDLSWLKNARVKTGLSFVKCIRLAGLGKTNTHLWLEKAEHIRSLTGKAIDICPEYSMSMGNAILQEAAVSGMDFVTSTFAGYGRERTYASTEILLLALKVLYKDSGSSGLNILPELKEFFEKCTNRKIPVNSPVIGENIFMYESGIHAGGIGNDPKTYEPYEPELVGRRRELVVGKHSGRRAVSRKLAELGFEVDEAELADLVQRVRRFSIKVNRSLCDDELIRAYTRRFIH